MIGQMLEGRYRIDAPIARGGMSMVFRGVDTRLDRPVAIKVMDPKFASDPQFLTRFELEARAVAKLKHPSLVAVYDQGVDGDHPFLIMELVEGGTLRELLRERGPMPPHAVRAVAEPVLAAIGVAHQAGLVHRDIKPENVLISDSGEVKIADFGLVRAVAEAKITSDSVILGTAAYLSPEQVTSGTADARSDVYSAGVLIFEMLTGRTPFTGDNSLSIALQRVEKDVPAPSRFITGIPPEIDELVAHATAREPMHRFANATEMAGELRRIARELQLPEYRVPAPAESAEHLSAKYRVGPTPAPHMPVSPPSRPIPGAADLTTRLPADPPTMQVQPQTQHTRVMTAAREIPPEYRPDYAQQPPGPPNNHGYQSDLIEDRGKSRRKVIIWLSIVLALAVLLGIGGWWLGVGRYSAVPSIAGMNTDKAVTALKDAGFRTETRDKASDTVPVGNVVGTDPPAGTRVTKGSLVAVLVSSGKPKVPNVQAGQDIQSVNKAIRDAGLTPVDAGEVGSTAAKGTLAKVDPAPGTVLPANAQVKVYRSKGSQPVKVPDVRGKTEDEAKTALQKAGLTVSSTRDQFDTKIKSGQVIGTDPAAGTSTESGTGVVLIVNSAIEMPNLLGANVSTARSKLQALGLSVTVRQLASNDSSIVISQSTAPGDAVEPGSTITLVAIP
ncbi:Stk1 family PASTA domain-containing Ser/Thr kinase [Nocardia seriolae]|uniref:Stk1 family PASTA domain-containing Ser/Thr kinase n=1 Tax=Nocardia seriolae TaxID=37332 RepID=UPI00051A77DF|nr:PASTA domain-containing protein [Nocardia seriolae]MTJ62291.1 PASTA domain-containing protein [Nocardia seriolae]MTJ70786.1 PASTA domain-containing protein [Nocardia seriolae]MTJ87197.1 PASTA domain-containing protein [Nocardia seriolae]MTK31191.1 PASTA domain-containing protein [Nocardia seriolae]MTK40242.1 PASTA domain-containing protein [Nocardia seriolae]